MTSDNTKPLRHRAAQYDLPDGTSRYYRIDSQQEMALRSILDYFSFKQVHTPVTKVDLDRALLVTVMKLESAQSVKLLSKFMWDGILKRAGHARYRLAMSGRYIRTDPQGNRSEWNLTEPVTKQPQLPIVNPEKEAPQAWLTLQQLREARAKAGEIVQGSLMQPTIKVPIGTLVEVGAPIWTSGSTCVYHGTTEEGERVLVIGSPFTE